MSSSSSATASVSLSGYAIGVLIPWALVTPLQFGQHIAALNQISTVLTCQVPPAAGDTATADPGADPPAPRERRRLSHTQVIVNGNDCLTMSDNTFSFVTSVFMMGGLVGNLFANKLLDRYGRKGCTRLNALLMTLGAATMALAQSVPYLGFGRFFIGVAAGVGLCTTPVYLDELSPPAIRGRVRVFNQLAVVIGILLIQGLGLLSAQRSQWRPILWFSALLGVLQLVFRKVPLASIGGPDLTLTADNNFVETVVHHEIKELGQHVLACTITYRLPNSTSEEPSTIRKYYKFEVTNPLSVKTKVFLKVHVQNLTADPLWFEQMKFECAENWLVDDANLTPDKTSIFTGAAELIQPQDTRQYVYILTPTAESIPSFPVVHAPGAVIPLGRLDTSWRSSFGSPDRLLTSMLSRRIPLAPAALPASALPPHLQRGRRPGSPTPSVPSTPPGSPFRARTMPQRPGSRPQSPAPSITSPTPTFASLAQGPLIYASTPPAPIDFDLAVLSVPREPVPRDTPFTVRLAITLAALPPAAGRTRFVSTAIQHVQPARPPNTHTAVSAALASNLQVPLRPTSPSPRGSVVLSRAPSIAGTETLVESPLAAAFQLQQQQQHSALGMGLGTMPPPHALEDAGHAPPADGVLFLGASSQTLPTFVFSQPETADATERQEHTREFELAFMSTRTGFATVGGLRLVLLSDEERVEAAASPPAPHRHETRILKEWDVVAEILVV